MSTTIDLKKDLKAYYNPSAKTPEIIEIPPMNFLMLDGQGSPYAPLYSQVVNTLYPLAYTIRFMVKAQLGIAYTVMPLQGLWWMEDMARFKTASKEEWIWTMMIMQPEFITAQMVAEAVEETGKKKDLPLLEQVRFESYAEGLSVQLMHIGPYADEAPNIERMHAYAYEQGCQLHGKHHEIYLSNPERVAPKKMKTIIRQPVKK